MEDDDLKEDGDSEFGLVCPFLNVSTHYAHGVEFGILFERMKSEDEISGLFLLDNQEQILLAANRLDWQVDECRTIETPGWFALSMHKR